MKAKKFLWVLMACILSLSLVAFAACDTGESDQFTVESVSLQETAEIKVGASVTLKYTVAPEGCTDTVTWRSSDTSVATVSNGADNAGQVTGVAAGEATITLQVGNLTDTCTVTVTQDETVAVTGIELNKTELTLTEGGSETLTATVTPDNATDKTVTWASNKESVATVENGVVTAVGEGTATITATAGGYEASCVVTVNPATVDVTGVTLDKTSATLYINGESGTNTVTLTATVTPDNATDKTVTWTSNKESVATVENGVVTAVGEGTATITASAGGKSAACTVTVLDGSNVVNVDTAEELVAAVADSDNEGKTIVLAEGEYTLTETVFITQDITLEGSNSTLTAGSTPWADVTNGRASIITVTNGADVTIRNLTVAGAKQSGSVYGHGVNLAQAGSVTLENVTATNNSGVGVLVNDTVATLKNVTTSGNAWGGVNVDVIGRDWDVPATVLTVDEACDFAEDAQIYCDDADEELALSWEGVLVLPDSYHKIGVVGTETIVWSDAVDTDTTIDTITIGGKNYTLTYATNGTAYESADTDPVWGGDGGYPMTGAQQVNNDFVAVFTWANTRDVNYADVWLEMFTASGQYFDLDVGNNTTSVGGEDGYLRGELATASGVSVVTRQLTLNGEIQDSWPGHGAEGAFEGYYTAVVVRVGTTLHISITQIQSDDDVYVYTYELTGFTADALTIGLNGNTYWVDEITATVGSVSEVTA
mgnify:CR=1 FL=1